MYKGKVIRNDSLDPNYKVQFSYADEKYQIREGEATFTRQSPYPKVVFNDHTDYLIEKQEMDDKTIQILKLEVGKTVFDFMYSTFDK